MIPYHGFKLPTSKHQACMATLRAQLRTTGNEAASSVPRLCITMAVINPCFSSRGRVRIPCMDHAAALRSKLETSAGVVFALGLKQIETDDA